MATLQGKQINNTYPGLIKTNDESALDPTVAKKLQDGSGNDTTISLSQDRAVFDGIIDLSAAAVTGGLFQMDVPNQIIKTRGVSTGNQTINLSPTDNSVFTVSINTIALGFDSAAGEGSVFLGKFGNAADGSSVVGFESYTNTINSGILGSGNVIDTDGTGLSGRNFIIGHGSTIPFNVTDVILLDSFATADESNIVMTSKPIKASGFKTTTYGEVIDDAGNWTGNPIVSGVQSVVAGTNVTVDNTDPANPVVSATGGGGGSATPPMGLDSLPGMAQSTFSELKSFRSWVPTSGYSTGETLGIETDQAQLCVFAMQEGEPIDYIRTAVGVAQAGATGSGAIYRAGKDGNGNLIATDKLYDLPTFDASTTGVKDFDLSASPFVMPAGETYGCIIIAFSTDVADVKYNSYGNAIWTGNGGSFGGSSGTTFYRTLQWHVVDAGIGGTSFPASLAGGTYDGETSNPIMVAINQ